MKKYILFLFALLAPCTFVHAQLQENTKMIFLSNLEKDNTPTGEIISKAATFADANTTVVLLGDNLPQSGNSQSRLRRQQARLSAIAQPFRQKGAKVIFIPGSYEWNKGGPGGLAGINRIAAFVNSKVDTMVRFLPGICPDPVAVPLSDSVVMIIMDTEWWLYPGDKTNTGEDCNCASTRDVANSLSELLYNNRYKTILLATSHPSVSYGNKGGRYGWKNQIFPLLGLEKHLYLPLPGIGSIYTGFRKTFNTPEDLHHPVYKDMLKNIDGVFRKFPNLVQVSGKEAGQQLIYDTVSNKLQVVTSARQAGFVGKQGNTLFKTTAPGFMVATITGGKELSFQSYSFTNKKWSASYSYNWSPRIYRQVETSILTSIQGDSIITSAHKGYEHSGFIHNIIFGKNYRSEWATPVKLPVIRVSEAYGGLKPVKLGGGFQSTSLKMVDGKGKEYALRTVEKSPDLVVPQPFSGTFVRALLDDATSAQHPYSALVVSPIADAMGVPHAQNTIGMAAPDSSLGRYNQYFDHKVVLLEEREPLGKSDNFLKMQKRLQNNNNNSYDAGNFLKARMIDVLLADWDRHGDQWRFYDEKKKGYDHYYIAIPRDRDMVFNVTEGTLPFLIKRLFVMPRVYGFRTQLLPGSNYYLFKSAFLNSEPASQIPHKQWTDTVARATSRLTDTVFAKALSSLPPEIDTLRHDYLLSALKQRRDKLPQAMEKYYRFSNAVVDIKLSDDDELVSIDQADNKDLMVTVRKLKKSRRAGDTLIHKRYEHTITREIRLYSGEGNDSIVVNNTSSPIKLKLIGGEGTKAYNIVNSDRKIRVYDLENGVYNDPQKQLSKHISADTSNTSFVPVNLYNTGIPLVAASYNPDDGIFLGAGIRYMHQHGFRKLPYASLHQLMVSHSFSTQAFNARYMGEWIKVVGNTDLTLDANMRAPDNTQNFFGRGNETSFDKTGNFKRYYRARFDLAELQPALRWRTTGGNVISVGPAIQYYHMNGGDNAGRLIANDLLLHSYDSATVTNDRVHAGVVLQFTRDKRNNTVLPIYGSYVHIKIQGYTGLNSYSKSYMQVLPESAVYKPLNARKTIIVSDRVGGGITLGQTAFYQSLFLGGQGNLSGFRQYRFAGQHSLYNNFEVRAVLSNFGSYVVKGQIGIIGFYDVGRVWEKGQSSDKWHNGAGGSLYFAPADLTVIKISVAYSDEGIYPTFSMGLRF